MLADSDHDANMLAVGMFVPDPFIYLRVRGREIIVMSDPPNRRLTNRRAPLPGNPPSPMPSKVRRNGKKDPLTSRIIRTVAAREKAKRF